VGSCLVWVFCAGSPIDGPPSRQALALPNACGISLTSTASRSGKRARTLPILVSVGLHPCHHGLCGHRA
jgi:hypothetical protein